MKVDQKTLKNYKFYFNLIITRYIFNSTIILKRNLRNSKNLSQILFYFNSNNFEEEEVDYDSNKITKIEE